MWVGIFFFWCPTSTSNSDFSPDMFLPWPTHNNGQVLSSTQLTKPGFCELPWTPELFSLAFFNYSLPSFWKRLLVWAILSFMTATVCISIRTQNIMNLENGNPYLPASLRPVRGRHEIGKKENKKHCLLWDVSIDMNTQIPAVIIQPVF